MKNWFNPLFPIILLVTAGIFVPLLYLRQSQRGDQANPPRFDRGSSLLAVLLLVAGLSMGLFLFFLLFT